MVVNHSTAPCTITGVQIFPGTIERLETVSNSLVMAGEFTTLHVVHQSCRLYASLTVSHKN